MQMNRSLYSKKHSGDIGKQSLIQGIFFMKMDICISFRILISYLEFSADISPFCVMIYNSKTKNGIVSADFKLKLGF